MRLPDRPTADDPDDDSTVPADHGVAAELTARLLRLPAWHPSAPDCVGDGRIAFDREWPSARGRVDPPRELPGSGADRVGGRRVWPGSSPDWLGADRPMPDYAADDAPGDYDDGPGSDDQGPAQNPESGIGVSLADEGESPGQPGQEGDADDGAGDAPADPGGRAGGPTMPGWIPARAEGAGADQSPYRPWFAASGSPEPWFATGSGDVLAGPG